MLLYPSPQLQQSINYMGKMETRGFSILTKWLQCSRWKQYDLSPRKKRQAVWCDHSVQRRRQIHLLKEKTSIHTDEYCTNELHPKQLHSNWYEAKTEKGALTKSHCIVWSHKESTLVTHNGLLQHSQSLENARKKHMSQILTPALAPQTILAQSRRSYLIHVSHVQICIWEIWF